VVEDPNCLIAFREGLPYRILTKTEKKFELDETFLCGFVCFSLNFYYDYSV
jgi:hypothetical protein